MIKNQALANAIRATFKTGDADDVAIDNVGQHIGRMSAKSFLELCMELASTKYNVAIKRAESSGKLMWDSKAENYETAKKRVNRLMDKFFPKDKSEGELEVPKHIQKLAKALADACAKHDDKAKRKLGAAALGMAW
jgi:hypothetical protein